MENLAKSHEIQGLRLLETLANQLFLLETLQPLMTQIHSLIKFWNLLNLKKLQWRLKLEQTILDHHMIESLIVAEKMKWITANEGRKAAHQLFVPKFDPCNRQDIAQNLWYDYNDALKHDLQI